MENLVLNKKNQLKKISKIFKLDLLVLFGSFSRLDFNKNSDIDFSYFSENDVDHYKLKFEFEKLFLFKKKIDLIDLSEKANYFLKYSIFKDGIKIYENKIGIFNKLMNKSFFDYIDSQELLMDELEIIDIKLKSINTKNFKTNLEI